MSRKTPKKSLFDEEEIRKRKDPPGCVPLSHPNELHATNRKIQPGPGTSERRRVVSSTRNQDTSPGAEALSRPRRLHPVSIEERRPGVVVVPGFDDEGEYPDDGLTIEEGYDEQVTIASHEESTVHIYARAVDTEEENRILREQDHILYERDQFRHERDQIRHERDRLRQILDDAPIVTPVVATRSDVENGVENVHARTKKPRKTTTTTTYSIPGSSPASAPIASMADSNSKTVKTQLPTKTTTTTTYSIPGSSPKSAPMASMADSNSRTARTQPPTTTTTTTAYSIPTTAYSIPTPTEMVSRVEIYLGR
jgi:hypothetical protein